MLTLLNLRNTNYCEAYNPDWFKMKYLVLDFKINNKP